VNVLLMSVYRFLVLPIAVCLLPLVSLFHRKIRKGFALRRRPWDDSVLRGRPQPLWIHAASGEFEYAKAVIREFKLRQPETPVVVTYFSPTYARAVEQFAGVDLALPLPLDLPGPCRSFLTRIKPRQLLIARTDIWPEMLTQCRRQGLRISVFSYTQKKFTSDWKRAFTRWILSFVDHIDCVSEDDRQNLLQISPPEKVTVLGDTRYDQVAHRLIESKLSNERAAFLLPREGCLTLVAGSTWSEDETALLAALEPFLKERRLRLIVVPHEPTASHLQELDARIGSLQLSSQRWSDAKQWDAAVLVVDQVGILADLYACGELAFVGGSFRKSVHSVMEALGTGARTFVGPYHENNREAMEFQHVQVGGRAGLEVVHSPTDLAAKMALILSEPEFLPGFRIGLRQEFRSRQGASQRLVGAVLAGR